MKSIYKKFEEIVRKKGTKVGKAFSIFRGEKSIWMMGDLLIVLDDLEPYTEASRIVTIRDLKKHRIIYLSPYVVSAGGREIFGIEDPDISSVKRLEEILKKIKRGQ